MHCLGLDRSDLIRSDAHSHSAVCAQRSLELEGISSNIESPLPLHPTTATASCPGHPIPPHPMSGCKWTQPRWAPVQDLYGMEFIPPLVISFDVNIIWDNEALSMLWFKLFFSFSLSAGHRGQISPQTHS